MEHLVHFRQETMTSIEAAADEVTMAASESCNTWLYSHTSDV
jgi:hypothetical protein